MKMLPDKYVPITDSIIGVAAFLYASLEADEAVSDFWERAKQNDAVTTFDRFVDALTFLFCIGLLEMDSGRLVKLTQVRAAK